MKCVDCGAIMTKSCPLCAGILMEERPDVPSVSHIRIGQDMTGIVLKLSHEQKANIVDWFNRELLPHLEDY